ncbi:MAG: 2TM domain-containing protein [Flavobacteriaceae bacterium]|nr:2TM domain-containing protein [Flavobacteriaceae bacterium]
MNFEDRQRSDSYLKAKKLVQDRKAFFIHLAIYLVVNIFISSFLIFGSLKDGDTLREALFDFPTFAVWIFWGVGIFFHFWRIFGQNIFFGKDWEARKVQEYMKEEAIEKGTYNE